MRYSKSRLFIGGALFIFLLSWYVSAFWYQLMLLQGNSMEPAYHSGQLLLVDKHTKAYQAGDVIAIHKAHIKGLLVKRIAAVPGDTVYIHNGIIYINEEPQAEFLIEYAGIAERPIILEEDCYFVLGDNLQESKDSRYAEIGLIKQTEIMGKVIQ